MYVDAAEVVKGAPIINGTACFQTNNGGWIEATRWWTRSVLN